jgi:pantetheine-phosphate adenylyltransferase
MTLGVYQGTFDPITNGHLDVVTRASKTFSHLILGVFDTPEKKLLFTTKERMEMCEESTKHLQNVEVRSFTGLAVDFARKIKATAMVRGLRSISDFDNEFAMDMMNRNLDPELTTVYLITRREYTFVSSTLIKEVARYGGNIKELVPEIVAKALQHKFN